MKKNTSTLLALGGIAAAIYFFSTTRQVSALSPVTAPRIVQSTTPNGDIVEETINTPEEGVDAINRAVSSGRTLIRTSRTLSPGVARLGDGSTVKIEVRQPTQDSRGLTALDRRILKNIQEAKARGENPTISNKLKPYVQDFR